MTREAKLLEGKVLAQAIQEDIKKNIRDLAARGIVPRLAALQVGRNSSADWYLGQQEKLAAKLGVRYEIVPSDALQDPPSLLESLRKLNRDKTCHGIFITMPLPSGFNSEEVLLTLDPCKDVEGIHPANLGLIVLRRARLIPPTAYAAFRLTEWAVKESGRDLRGMTAVIAGQSAIVGRPLQLLLGERRVTSTVCNTGTSQADLQKFVSGADLVIACAGQPGLIQGSWIKPGAIVIDVGTTEVNGNLTGDVEFEEARKRAGFITPVPGGVGPLTVTMLMQNLMNACNADRGS